MLGTSVTIITRSSVGCEVVALSAERVAGVDSTLVAIRTILEIGRQALRVDTRTVIPFGTGIAVRAARRGGGRLEAWSPLFAAIVVARDETGLLARIGATIAIKIDAHGESDADDKLDHEKRVRHGDLLIAIEVMGQEDRLIPIFYGTARRSLSNQKGKHRQQVALNVNDIGLSTAIDITGDLETDGKGRGRQVEKTEKNAKQTQKPCHGFLLPEMGCYGLRPV